MIFALMLPLLGVAPSNAALAVARSDGPPIKVWLNQDNYFRRGDKARVNVQIAADGYVVVLRADGAGRVRVLFPLDPTDDDFVRGGEGFEVRGRGDREAFVVDERDGNGVVLAARSAAPFKVDEFVRGDHWDYRVLDAREAGDDKEAALLDLVQRMVPDGHFDYDVQKYFVAAPRATAYYDDYAPSFGMGLGYGWGWPYSQGFYGRSCFDPFYYDPFFCRTYYDPIYFGYSPYSYSPFYYRPYVFYTFRPFQYYPRFGGGGGWLNGFMHFKNLPGTNPPVAGVGPRLRLDRGTLLRGRATRPGVPVRVRDASLGAIPARGRAPVQQRPSFAERARNERPMPRSAPIVRREDHPAMPALRAPVVRPAERSAPGRGPSYSGGGGGRSSGGGGWSGGGRSSGGGGRSSGGSRGGGGGGRGGGGGGGGRRGR